jgi:hypothetical protein
MQAPANLIVEEIRVQRMVSSLTKRETLADMFSPMSVSVAPARRAPRNMNLIVWVLKAIQQKKRATSV